MQDFPWIVRRPCVMQRMKPCLAACRMWEDHSAERSVGQCELAVTLLTSVWEHHA